jgi:DNA-binding transcriptional MerR regulator
LTIKEVAAHTGLPPSTIRYYDQQFADYIGVVRGPGRRRLFSAQAVERLLEVQHLLKEEGLSVRQARQLLMGEGGDTAGLAALRAEVDGLREELARLRKEVEALQDQVAELREIQRRTLGVLDGLARG